MQKSRLFSIESLFMKSLIRVIMTCLMAASMIQNGAWAHEGHGKAPVGEGNSVTHYLTEPYHLSQILGGLAIVVAVVWIGYRWWAARHTSHKIAT
jgi:hypothetical protein